MIDIKEILSGNDISSIITALKERSTKPHDWATLRKDYEPSLHEIMTDMQGRKDKIHTDGSKDKAARLAIGLERLLTKRMNEFTFAIPVKRNYFGDDTDEKKEVVKAIERIYQVAHIDSENKKRGLNYYASCEAMTVWYTKKGRHNLYGFPCNYKLKCKTFSPMDGTTLWPLIDEFGEMYAMSFEYTRKVKDVFVTFFETYTADRHYIWKQSEGAEWEVQTNGEEISIGKIPAVYIYRYSPVWEGLTGIREEIEYALSRHSDILAYNSAPILKVAGSLVGEEMKGETRRIYRVTEGGDVSYVSWAQSNQALEYYVNTLLNVFFMQAQMPDISFSTMTKLGNIGYDARKTLLTDAHLKIGDESGAWIEFLERENSIIKAFLKKLNVGFKEDDVDSILIENVITPFIQEDEMQNIEKWSKAGGGTPLVSPLEAIEGAGLSEDPQASLAQILATQAAQQALQAQPSEAMPTEEAGGGETEETENNETNEINEEEGI